MSLQIAGVVPLSSIDWPDHLCATVFCQGCPWKCTYCHNVDIIDPRTPGCVNWSEVLDLLDRRRGLLDGVVFTGGEALRQPDLPSSMAEVKDRGFSIGLHTAGCYPNRLREVLPMVDWVGLDIKGLPDQYPTIVGGPGGARAWECLDIVLSSGVDYEVRTTVHPDSPVIDTFDEFTHTLRGLGVTNFALQNARATGTSASFQSAMDEKDHATWGQVWAGLVEIVTDRFEGAIIRN